MLKAAVIGTSEVAREHLGALRSLCGVETVGLCDSSAALAEATAEEFGLQAWFTDHRRMLEEVRPDVVHIAAPVLSRVPLAIGALEAKAHVLVESPMALDRGRSEEVLRTAQESNRLLIENYNFLFNPPVQRILGLVQSGELGEVIHVDASLCTDILGNGEERIDFNGSRHSRGLPDAPIVDVITRLAYLAHAFVGAHRAVHSAWTHQSGDSSVRCDGFRASVDGERGTASLGFSAHVPPDVFALRVHGTRMRAMASLFVPLLRLERNYAGPWPLIPLRNRISAARAHASSAVGALWSRLRGSPEIYSGLRTLVRRFYEGLGPGSTPPIAFEQVDAVNRLVHDLLDGVEEH